MSTRNLIFIQIFLIALQGRAALTRLIQEFVKDKNAIFFAAREATAQNNLVGLSRAIYDDSGAPVFSDFDLALEAIFKKARNERLVFVIDEYPYLAESYRGISSYLQHKIDHNRNDTKIMIILCGSSMSFMEHQVLGYKSPLYGRRTAQFKIQPFVFFDSLPFFAGFDNPTDKATLYAITGGVPEYLIKINAAKSAQQNIIDLFFRADGLFYEEPGNLLKQELREPATYNTIIEAIAGGASKLNEIATKSHIETSKCSKYLSSLIALGLVEKQKPYNERMSKRSIYRLNDQIFRFWYRFVFPNKSVIELNQGEALFNNTIKKRMDAFMGFAFEEICKQWLYRQMADGQTLFFPTGFGRWWGTNPKTKTQEEIDIIALGDERSEGIFAECKWSDNLLGESIYHELKRKSEIFPHTHKQYYIFAKTGFDKNFTSSKGIHLVSLVQMFGGYGVDWAYYFKAKMPLDNFALLGNFKEFG